MAKEDEHVSQTGKSWIHRLETRIIYKNSSLSLSLRFKRTINVEIIQYDMDTVCSLILWMFNVQRLFFSIFARLEYSIYPFWIHAVRFEGVRSWFLQHTIWLVWNYRGYRQMINLSTEHNDQPSSLLQPIFGQIKFLHFWVIGPICKDEMAGQVLFKQRYG